MGVTLLLETAKGVYSDTGALWLAFANRRMHESYAVVSIVSHFALGVTDVGADSANKSRNTSASKVDLASMTNMPNCSKRSAHESIYVNDHKVAIRVVTCDTV